MTVEAFMLRHWEKLSLSLPGALRRVPSLALDLPAFLDAVTERVGQPRPAVKAQYFDAEGEHAEFPLPPGSVRLVKELLDAGMTVCVCDFDALHGPTRQLSASLAAAAGVPDAFDVSCYVSGRGAGFGLHLDDVPVLIAQCQGRKRWRYGLTPAVPHAPRNLVASDVAEIAEFARLVPRSRVDVPDERELAEVTLEPDDALFLPAGTWHRTFAEELSIGLTFTLSPRRLDAWLAAALARNIEHGVRWVPSPGAGDTSGWVANRLALLREALLRVTDERAFAALRSAPNGPGRSAFGVGGFGIKEDRPPAARSPAHRPLQRSSLVRRLTAASPITYTKRDEEGERVLVVCGRGDAVELPMVCAGLVEGILGRDCFVADEATGWSGALSWNDIRKVLDSLDEIGVVSVEAVETAGGGSA